MPRLFIEAWEWDDGNLSELARDGLSRRLVLQVAERDPRFRRNRKGRASSHQMIGPDDGGRTWGVCIAERPGTPGLWRTVTGWEARRWEMEWYRRSR